EPAVSRSATIPGSSSIIRLGPLMRKARCPCDPPDADVAALAELRSLGMASWSGRTSSPAGSLCPHPPVAPALPHPVGTSIDRPLRVANTDTSKALANVCSLGFSLALPILRWQLHATL